MPSNEKLLVPIQVHALFQSKNKFVIGPEMDFESLPYHNATKCEDVNPATPYLAESVIARPFEDSNYLLKKGVHLNWDFPHFLKTTKFGSTKPTEFPAVPTRWLITRYRQGIEDKKWVVESDALLENLDGANVKGMAQTSIEADIYNERPFTYIGKATELNEWKSQTSNTNFTTWKGKHNQRPLTALGWGSPSFDIFYPNCHSVFGFHDKEISDTEGISYSVIGWYPEKNKMDDYWSSYLKIRQSKIDEIIAHLNALDHLSLEEKEEIAQNALKDLIQKDLGLEVDTAPLVVINTNTNLIETDLPEDGMICYGKVTVSQSTTQPTNNTLYGMGNTPTEALSALIIDTKTSATGPEREKQEDILEAILMGDQLKSLKTDIGPKFREFRHTKEFTASKGGTQWIIKEVDDNPNKKLHGDPQAKKEQTLFPNSLADPLDRLNNAQRAYDKSLFELDSWKKELYADWYRYMHCCYPPPGETEELFEVSEVKSMIENRTLKKYTQQKKALGEKLEYNAANLASTETNKQTGLSGEVRTAWKVLLEELTKVTKERLMGLAEKSADHLKEALGEMVKNDTARTTLTTFIDSEKVAIKNTFDAFASTQVENIKSNGFTSIIEKNIHAELSKIIISRKPNWSATIDSIHDLTNAEKTTLRETLTDKNLKAAIPRAALYHWEIRHQPAARFWEPTAPAIVIAIERNSANPPIAPNTTFRKKLLCTKFDGNVTLTQSSAFDIASLLQQIGVPDNSDQPTEDLTFKAEWEVEVFPTATMHASTRNSGTFDPEFIISNYFLGENEPDLTETPTLNSHIGTTSSGNIYLGNTFVNKNLGQRYQGLLDDYEHLHKDVKEKTEVKTIVNLAKDFLENYQLLVVSLNDFNSALLQTHQSIQLKPADPLGFKSFEDFANKISLELGEGKGFSPDSYTAFMPIIAGNIKVFSIRIIDCFGRYTAYEPTAISKPTSMMVKNHSDFAKLQPRYAQAARFNFRFLKSHNEQEALEVANLNDSPICGWIVPNLLDNSLLFYQNNGKKLGEFDQTGTWKKQQGSPDPTGCLGKLKDWFEKSMLKNSETDSSKFPISAFINDIEEALDTIHPEDRESQSSFSFLMGRPIAVVRVGVDLELKGLPATNISWAAFHKDLMRLNRDTADFEKVKMPFRLGEYRQRNDGLIGYWEINDQEQLADRFNVTDAIRGDILKELSDDDIRTEPMKSFNEAWSVQDDQGRTLQAYIKDEKAGDNTIKKQDLIQHYFRDGSKLWEKLKELEVLTEEKKYEKIAHYSESERLKIAPIDARKEFLCLLDPHGAIHLTSGIQPVKAINLPEIFVKSALENIEVDFMTAPVLGPETAVQISLPKEQNYSWRWEEKNGPLQTTTPIKIEEKKLTPFINVANFPDRVIIRDGKLFLTPKKDINPKTT